MKKINKILWLTWKDFKHPSAGGAELVNEQIAKRLAAKGYKVIFIVRGFKTGLSEETVNGYKIIRLGRGWSLPWLAFQYYKKHLAGWPDLVIEEINTIPFLSKFYVKERNILLIYQLCREIIFYQTFFPVNLISYLFEPLYLYLLRNHQVITISESTKSGLLKYGFKKENLFVISAGIDLEPLSDLLPMEEIKEKKPTILFLAALRKMKRPDQIIRGFEIARKKIAHLKLWLVGASFDKSYLKKIMKMIENSQYKKHIKYWGWVSEQKKSVLLQRAHILCVPSIKEGWGLAVTEANSQGTPAIVYNVDGLRDSVKQGITGIVCQKNTPENLAENIVYLLKNKEKYNFLRENAWQWSKQVNFEKSCQDFINVLEKI